eukprot:364808-Chlamydomonas_euryale.AAC.8
MCDAAVEEGWGARPAGGSTFPRFRGRPHPSPAVRARCTDARMRGTAVHPSLPIALSPLPSPRPARRRTTVGRWRLFNFLSPGASTGSGVDGRANEPRRSILEKATEPTLPTCPRATAPPSSPPRRTRSSFPERRDGPAAAARLAALRAGGDAVASRWVRVRRVLSAPSPPLLADLPVVSTFPSALLFRASVLNAANAALRGMPCHARLPLPLKSHTHGIIRNKFGDLTSSHGGARAG